MAKPASSPFADWSRWADRAIARGPREAARALRFLPDQRATLTARLDAAARKGA